MGEHTHAFASHMFNSNPGPWNKESCPVFKAGWEVLGGFCWTCIFSLESLTLEEFEENS